MTGDVTTPALTASGGKLTGTKTNVPFGMVANVRNRPIPPGFEAKPSPFGVSFAGSACSEPRLLALAYAFEQVTKRRVPPASVP